METRATDAKVTADEYREAARRLLEGCPRGVVADINHWAYVHPTSGGAFVEVALWVPDTVIGVVRGGQ